MRWIPSRLLGALPILVILAGLWAAPLWAAERPPALRGVHEDSQRHLEILIEIAWLADPVTFPYFLEARAENNTLEVRGYVPSKLVREQAIRIARLQCPVTVVDALREHPSLTVRPTRLPAAQLHAAIQTALKEAFPKQHHHLAAQCTAEGKVTLVGAVRSFEEKLAVGHALRRLHGCSAVQNELDVLGAVPQPPAPTVQDHDLAQKPNPPIEGPLTAQLLPPVTANVPPTTQAKLTTQGAGTTSPIQLIPTGLPGTHPAPVRAPRAPRLGPLVLQAPPTKIEAAQSTEAGPPQTPNESRGVVMVAEPTSTPDDPLTVRLQKRIEQACPGAKDVQVRLLPEQNLRIDLHARSEEELREFAGRIFALQEVQAYKTEINIILPQP